MTLGRLTLCAEGGAPRKQGQRREGLFEPSGQGWTGAGPELRKWLRLGWMESRKGYFGN